MLGKLKEKISEIEKAAEHAVLTPETLLAHLDEARMLLDMAAKAAHAVVPGTPIDIALTAADSVADALCSAHD